MHKETALQIFGFIRRLLADDLEAKMVWPDFCEDLGLRPEGIELAAKIDYLHPNTIVVSTLENQLDFAQTGLGEEQAQELARDFKNGEFIREYLSDPNWNSAVDEIARVVIEELADLETVARRMPE